MHQRLELDIDKGELDKETFRFCHFDDRNELILDGYVIWHKETKRKGWKAIKSYDRLRTRDNSIQEADVPLTEEIKAKAMRQFIKIMSEVKVLKWDERAK